MALHLHVLCKKTGPGALQRENLRWDPPDSRVLRSGVWLLSAADLAQAPDFIWLHADSKADADLGGRVIAVAPASASDLTVDHQVSNLAKRITVTFEKQTPVRIPWPSGLPLPRQVYTLEFR